MGVDLREDDSGSGGQDDFGSGENDEWDLDLSGEDKEDVSEDDDGELGGVNAALGCGENEVRRGCGGGRG